MRGLPKSGDGTPSVDLLLPGLFRGAGDDARSPRLERLLARSVPGRLPVVGVWPTLFTLCGGAAVAANPPLAPCCALADGEVPGAGYLFLATPVYLSVEQARVRLFTPGQIGISGAEADLLVAELNGHFGSDGWRFQRATAGRWYLHPPRPPALHTSPLEEAIGQHIDPLLPTGPDARRYHALLNEVQMLLHLSAVNQRRELAGRPPINGVWLHGGGTLPTLDGLPYARIYSDDPCARGIALQAGGGVTDGARPQLSTLAAFDQWNGGASEGRVLLFSTGLLEAETLGDRGGRDETLGRLDQGSIARLLGALRQGHIAEINLYPADGRVFRLSRNADRRFWRRNRPLHAYRTDR